MWFSYLSVGDLGLGGRSRPVSRVEGAKVISDCVWTVARLDRGYSCFIILIWFGKIFQIRKNKAWPIVCHSSFLFIPFSFLPGALIWNQDFRLSNLLFLRFWGSIRVRNNFRKFSLDNLDFALLASQFLAVILKFGVNRGHSGSSGVTLGSRIIFRDKIINFFWSNIWMKKKIDQFFLTRSFASRF